VPRGASGRELQGLRAVAVVALVLYALTGQPRGGFVGVDVLFVVSGFLMTSSLLREHDETGSISVLGFYRRRVKRAVPAALVVLAVTAAVAFALVNARYGRSVAGDELWALGLAANWHLLAQGAAGAHVGAGVSPVQHFWAVSIVAQFWLAWPWLILLVLRAAGAVLRSGRGARVALVLVVGAVTAGSFAWSLLQSAAAPGAAYFSTFSRAWEPGVGALLAFAVPLAAALPSWLRPVLAWLGIAALAGSVALVGSSAPFPAPAALPAVLATALIVIAASGGEPRFAPLLRSRPFVLAGDMAYSLFLWHLPAIVVMGFVVGPGRIRLLSTAAVIAFFTVASYYLVERPVRDSLWLSGLDVRERRLRRAARAKPLVSVVAVIAVLLAADLGATAATVARDRAAAARAVTLARGAGRAAVLAAPPPTQEASAADALTARLQNALAAADWPKLSPPSSSLSAGTASVDEWLHDGCLDVGPDNVADCVYGNTASATRSVAVLGDSYAVGYLPAIRRALGGTWRIQVLTADECPAEASLSVTRSDGAPDPACDAHHVWASQWLSVHRQDLVIIADSPGTIGRIAGARSGGAEQRATYRAALGAQLKALAPVATRTVVLESPPARAKLQSCQTAVSHPSDCVTSVLQSDVAFAQAQRLAVEAAGAHARFVGTQAWFCVNGKCPSFLGTAPATSDGGHLTEAASQALAPVLAAALAAAGVGDVAERSN
jgi:peptidoglycan/LPS O-acetylase OafA/YrhL